MVTVIDVGNTNIHVGIYDVEKLLEKFTFRTDEFSENRIEKILTDRKLEGVAIASVVPAITKQLKKFFKKTKITPIVISSKLNCGLRFGYHDPASLGADRIANVVGALENYKKDSIVVDFGTATTLDVVFKNGYYPGGIITPGIDAMLEILHTKTALLPKVTLKRPKNIIGRSTADGIQSGIFYGFVEMIRSLIHKIIKHYKCNFKIVATGGWCELLTSHIEEIEEFNPNLCLYGILKIYYYNV